MNISEIFFIRKPVAHHAPNPSPSHYPARSPSNILPVSPLPQVDFFPTISVSAVAAWRQPGNRYGLFRRDAARAPVRPHRLCHRDDVAEQHLGSTGITLQFDLNRDIDAAAPRRPERPSMRPAAICRRICPRTPATRRSIPPIHRSSSSGSLRKYSPKARCTTPPPP